MKLINEKVVFYKYSHIKTSKFNIYIIFIGIYIYNQSTKKSYIDVQVQHVLYFVQLHEDCYFKEMTIPFFYYIHIIACNTIIQIIACLIIQ